MHASVGYIYGWLSPSLSVCASFIARALNAQWLLIDGDGDGNAMSCMNDYHTATGKVFLHTYHVLLGVLENKKLPEKKLIRSLSNKAVFSLT